MNRTWEKLKKTYEDNRIAMWLLCVFVIFFCIISGPGIVEEVSSGSAELMTESSDAEAWDGESNGASKKSGAQADEEKSGMVRAASDAAGDVEAGGDAEDAEEALKDASEKSDAKDSDKTAKNVADEDSEEDFLTAEIEAVGDETSGTAAGEDEPDSEPASRENGAADSKRRSDDSEDGAADSKDRSDDSEDGAADSKDRSDDSENEETEPESATDPENGETEPESATNPKGEGTELVFGERWLLRLAAQYGASFKIPMALADETVVTFVPLGEKWKLRGYEELEAEFEEWQRRERPLGTLERMLTRRLDTYDGDWSVYVKNLSTDESFVINDRPMKSASVMKLFIMGTVYKAFETGDLSRTDEVMSLVGQMITVSSNEASNELLYRLGDGSYADGIAKVDAFIEEYGFSDMTVEYNGFNDPATNTSSEHFNQVAARDCGKLLEDIYRRTWMNRSVSNEMEDLLLSQETRYKIPAGLPDGVLCGNKTGEMDTTENDAAIIYTDECDYILVVLSSDWDSKDQAISRIQSISAATWKYLNLTEYEMVVAE